jgi:hypothetical protein
MLITYVVLKAELYLCCQSLRCVVEGGRISAGDKVVRTHGDLFVVRIRLKRLDSLGFRVFRAWLGSEFLFCGFRVDTIVEVLIGILYRVEILKSDLRLPLRHVVLRLDLRFAVVAHVNLVLWRLHLAHALAALNHVYRRQLG